MIADKARLILQTSVNDAWKERENRICFYQKLRGLEDLAALKRYFPCHWGGRLLIKASIPSFWSSVAKSI